MRPLVLLLALAMLVPCTVTLWGQYNPPNATPPIPPPPSLAPSGGRLLSPSQQNASNSATITATGSATETTSTNSSPATATSAKNIVMPPSMDKIDDKRPLVPGDVINYRVVEDRDAPRSLPVLDTGEMEVPLLGRVTASGKTLKKLAEEIKGLLEKDYYYQATVLLSMDSMVKPARGRLGKIYVLGQVRSAGVQDIPDDEVYTVSKAILRAGGFADFADKRKIKLVRKKASDSKETDTTIVDCTEVFEKGDTSHDPLVKADDIIIVPQRLINF